MSVMLDLIGSFVIGGMLLLAVLNLNATLIDSSYQNTLDLIVQENLALLGELIQYDFRKIGFGVSDPTTAILLADSTRITFQADMDRDGDVDTLSYYTGDTTEAGSTLNPEDRLFYRVINSEPAEGDAWGVTEFKLRYLDASGSETGDLGSIRAIEVSLTLQGAYPYGKIVVEGVERDRYSQATWEATFWPRSLAL